MYTLVQPSLAPDLLNARIYAELAAASELMAGLTRKPKGTALAQYKVRTDRLLTALNRSLRAMLSALEPLAARGTPASAEALGAIASVRNSVVESYRVCSRILGELEEREWVSQKKLGELSRYRERLLDLADWIDAIAAREETDAKFQAALVDLANGDVAPWSAVQ
jgi:hypothetical protein